jgi:hypothetical protein
MISAHAVPSRQSAATQRHCSRLGNSEPVVLGCDRVLAGLYGRHAWKVASRPTLRISRAWFTDAMLDYQP